jgi:osmoprotectant transport system substrate-binding protein
MRRLTALIGACLVAAALLAGGCGGSSGDEEATTGAAPPSSGPPIRIGGKNFTEQAILGELYRQALEAKGYDVVLKLDVGSSEIIHRALRRGALDMYPEYIGILLSEVAKERQRPRSAAAAYDAAQRFEKGNGFTLLEQTPFADANALGVKPKFAARHGLRTVGDLRKLKGRVRIAALPEFGARYEGRIGLRAVYGLRNIQVVPVEGEQRYSSLDSGRVDVASVFTSEAQLAGDKYLVLDDTRRLFASGHVAPVVNDKLLQAHGPQLRAAIDAVTGLLTTPVMREMNAAVDVQGQKATDVAARFLRAHGLL